MVTLAWIILFLVVMLVLGFQRASILVFAIAMGVLLLLVSFLAHVGWVGLVILWIIFALIFLPLTIVPLRRYLFTRQILPLYRKAMPKMSRTEREALASGTVGWSADVFSGKPNWNKLLKLPGAVLSAEEQAFLDGPVERLCEMIDDWEISRSMQIPKEIWDHLKREGFFGMIIPKQYGGKEFSNTAHSAVIVKVSGVSIAVATILGVPNSLGPAELLLHYGTDEQKKYYLPRLAKGEEIPCFALTSPIAGSDAASIRDYGVVCKANFEGKEQLCIRLNWNKRYISLAPVATILGLAFKLYDPENLLSEENDLGITCALIPTTTSGVVVGRRHYPLDSAFPNGPTQGKDVIIPADWIIGGKNMAGKGWRMLMECLAAGRSISLPSMAVAGARRMCLATGAYARIRRQFNTYIGSFGGIEEALSKVVAYTYMADATREFTIAALDQGGKPVVASAISKYHCTELSRHVVLNAMDVHGGKAICMGPHNYVALTYIQGPIGITVEGANILTRSMIIFGQGAIRSHPFVLKELEAAENKDHRAGLKQFDKAFFAHLGYLISNFIRSFWLAVTGGRLIRAPRSAMHRYYQQFSRYSAIFAFVADICMITIGSQLKRREKLSARLGDLLSYLYVGSAVLKYYEANDDETRKKTEAPVVHWACEEILYKLQTQLDELLINIPSRLVAGFLRFCVFPFGKRMRYPTDQLGRSVAKLILEPSSLRERMAKNIYYAPNENNLIGEMEKILEQAIAVEPIEKKLHHAVHHNQISGKTLEELISVAVAKKIIEESEAKQLLAVDALRMKVINVDDFPAEMFKESRHKGD